MDADQSGEDQGAGDGVGKDESQRLGECLEENVHMGRAPHSTDPPQSQRGKSHAGLGCRNGVIELRDSSQSKAGFAVAGRGQLPQTIRAGACADESKFSGDKERIES